MKEKNILAGVGYSAILLLSFSLRSSSNDSPSRSQRETSTDSCSYSIVCPGEELLYEVSWMGIHLGQIRLRTLETSANGTYNCVGNVDSYDGIPFVDLHAESYTEMTRDFYSSGFHAIEKKDKGQWRAEKSFYDLQHNTVVIEKIFKKGKDSPPVSVPTYDTIYLKEKPIQDGLSVFYFARAHAHHRDTLTVPIIVYSKWGHAFLHFSSVPEEEELDAINGARVRVIPFDGQAKFKGMFGFTGEFKGWISDDNAAVPLKAELKVLLGSVKLELVSWIRNGWSPPTISQK